MCQLTNLTLYVDSKHDDAEDICHHSNYSRTQQWLEARGTKTVQDVQLNEGPITSLLHGQDLILNYSVA